MTKVDSGGNTHAVGGTHTRDNFNRDTRGSSVDSGGYSVVYSGGDVTNSGGDINENTKKLY